MATRNFYRNYLGGKRCSCVARYPVNRCYVQKPPSPDQALASGFPGGAGHRSSICILPFCQLVRSPCEGYALAGIYLLGLVIIQDHCCFHWLARQGRKHLWDVSGAVVSSYRGWGGRGATPWPTGPVRLGRFCLSLPRSGAVAKSNRSRTGRCCRVFLSCFLRIVRGDKIPGSIRPSLLSLSNPLCPHRALFGPCWVFLSAVNAARSGRMRSSKHRLLQIILLRLALGFLVGRAAVPTAHRFSSAHLCHMAKAVATIALPQGGAIGKGLARIPGTLHHHAPGAIKN